MMIYGIYDSCSDTLQAQLYTFENAGVARRAFKSAVAKEARALLGSVLDEPGDFYLVELGELDQMAGAIKTQDSKRIFRFSELMEVRNNG